MSRCRRHGSQPIDASDRPCPAFTSFLDCRTCGACCREGYHVVEVSRRDPFARSHPHLLIEQGPRLALPRPDGSCVCLSSKDGRHSCTVYADRPRSCREFELKSENCLSARRRLGLTP